MMNSFFYFLWCNRILFKLKNAKIIACCFKAIHNILLIKILVYDNNIKGNRLVATKCVFEKQQLPPHLQAITRLSEDSLGRL